MYYLKSDPHVRHQPRLFCAAFEWLPEWHTMSHAFPLPQHASACFTFRQFAWFRKYLGLMTWEEWQRLVQRSVSRILQVSSSDCVQHKLSLRIYGRKYIAFVKTLHLSVWKMKLFVVKISAHNGSRNSCIKSKLNLKLHKSAKPQKMIKLRQHPAKRESGTRMKASNRANIGSKNRCKVIFQRKVQRNLHIKKASAWKVTTFHDLAKTRSIRMIRQLRPSSVNNSVLTRSQRSSHSTQIEAEQPTSLV